MIRLFNISGLLSLLYLWGCSHYFTISPNPSFLHSNSLVDGMRAIFGMNILMNLILMFLVLLYIISIFEKTPGVIMCIVSLVLITILGNIALSILLLDNNVPLLFFNIHHTIFLDQARVDYFYLEGLAFIYNQTPVDNLSVVLQIYHMWFSDHIDDIRKLNASEIRKVIDFMVAPTLNAYLSTPSSNSWFFTISGAIVMFVIKIINVIRL